MDKIKRNFLKQGTNSQKKNYLISSSNVCNTRASKWLGIIKVNSMNKALLMKLFGDFFMLILVCGLNS